MRRKFSFFIILGCCFIAVPTLLPAQKTQTYFVTGDSIEVKSAPTSTAETIKKVDWGRNFKAISYDENWMEIEEIDSNLHYIPAKFMAKKKQFIKLTKNKSNKNAQTFYTLMEHYQSRNRLRKVKKYARQVLMEAPPANFYSEPLLTKKSQDGKYIVYEYNCRNIYTYAVETFQPKGNVSKFFNDLENAVTDDLVRFYIGIRKIPAFEGGEKQRIEWFSANEKILLEMPDVIKGDGENPTPCKPDETKNLWRTSIYFNYLIADEPTKLEYKMRINEIYQQSTNEKTEGLAKEILDIYEKLGNKTFEEALEKG